MKNTINTAINNNKAFTLIELLVVVGLMGLIVGVTSDILISVTKSYNKTQVLNEIEQQANFVSSKLTKELRDATDVTIPASAGATGNDLEFTSKSGSKIKYSLSGGVLSRAVDAGTALAITSAAGLEGVSVECLGACFTLNSSDPDIVSYSFTFKKPSGATIDASIIVSDTTVLRGTY